MDYANFEKKSLSEVAVLYIKDKILSGVLKSGDKLIETDISNELSISRAPVREALRSLNEQGVITFSPRKGNQVLDLSREEILEVFSIRIALEIQILHILVIQQQLTNKDFEHLIEQTDRMLHIGEKLMKEEEKVYLLNTYDIAFHSYLWNASKNMRRAQLLESLFFQLLIIMNKNVDSLGTFHDKAQEHLKIINALQSNKLESAVEAFQLHLRTYLYAIVTNFTTSELKMIKALESLYAL